jgi:CMP-N-acetylneuraminic acid synthetase
MDEETTALVPMKAHSERVPQKNTRTFNGRPLFHWILGTLTTAKGGGAEGFSRPHSGDFGHR